MNGNNFVFYDTSIISSGTLTHLWNFGAGITDTSNSNNPDKIYYSDNSYLIKLIETSDNGCKDSTTGFVLVTPKPNVAFTVNNSVQCEKANNFIFNDSSTISRGSFTRTWIFSNGDTSSLFNLSKTFNSADTIFVKFISSSNFGCSDSVTKRIIINAKPNAGFTINDSSQCLNGNNFIFNDTSMINNGTLSGTWFFSNGDSSSQTNFSKTFSSANNYSVKLISMSDKGCIDSITKNITVFPQPKSGFTINDSLQCLSGNNFIFSDTSTVSKGILKEQTSEVAEIEYIVHNAAPEPRTVIVEQPS
ncbi:MAG: PKD domain-containing protein, partial [Bacteroidia bacterium]